MKKTTIPRTTGPTFANASSQQARLARGSAHQAAAASRPNGVKRRAFVRMKKIFGWLQDGLYPNCTSIARDLEVSVKTAVEPWKRYKQTRA